MIIQMLAMILSLNLTATVHAQTSAPTIVDEIKLVQAAIEGSRAFVQSARQKDFSAITHEQLNNAIGELAQDLRDRNDNAMATELESHWAMTQFQIFSLNKELGDHSPLLPWLEDFLQKMATKYGTLILTLPIVQDIRTLNFAIPVVFAPRGNWQVVGSDNRIEYRKHFIPFANIVTYNAAKYGCLYLVKKNGLDQLKSLCSKVADELKFLMGRYVAPVISDFIFKSTNNASSLELADKDLVDFTAEQLLQILKAKE